MSGDARPSGVRIAALLAELIVTERLPDFDEFTVSWSVNSRELALLYSDHAEAQTVAASVLYGGERRTYDRSVSAAGNVHCRWSGVVHGVNVIVTGVAAEDGIPTDLDPLSAVDEDDYLRRLIALGLVVDE